ncbi:MAG TPA: thiopurine S-methyltransferase [Polyangiaceae bacterium]|nr:thiopurine S-methyltransferase [Polyangiaceae bacterium]
MKPEYWLERWQENRIGFHRDEPNPRLVGHQRALNDTIRVLVPLCGKSVDLEWLAVHGFEVVGIELSDKAARAFFEERQITPTRQERGAFVVYQHSTISIWVGDFFATDADELGYCDAAYDRAAMIALPPDLRKRYVEHLPKLLSPKAKLLLVTLEYDAEGGPPFAVTPAEIAASYPQARITQLGSYDARPETPGPIERGATWVHENVHLVEFP